MRGTLTLTFATTVAIGMLALAVGAVTVTSALQTAQAEKGCAPYGALVSHEARTTDSNNPDDTRKGFGDEVTPYAQQEGSFGQQYREAGNKPTATCGQSDEVHGNAK
jgi:hypothetical protein